MKHIWDDRHKAIGVMLQLPANLKKLETLNKEHYKREIDTMIYQ